MHLDSLTIKNFRILEDVTIEKLGHVNLIVGKNNSGKSTVLEALALLASGFETEVLNLLTDNRNVNRHENIQNERKSIFKGSFHSFFTNAKHNYLNHESIIIGSAENFIEMRYQPFVDDNNKNFNDKSLNHYTPYDFIQGLSLSVVSNLNLGFIDGNRPFSEIPTRPIAFGYVTTSNINLKDLAEAWDKIALSDDETLVLEILQLIEPKIQNFAFLSSENSESRIPFVRIKDVENRIPLHSMGDGIFRLLQIILKVLNARNGFLLIDEFENGLHYSVQPKVWELIFELAHRFNIQVFATTHSWDCIESFAQVAKDRTDMDGVLFRMGHSVRKSDNGKLIATVFDEDELYNLTKMQMEVR